MKKGIIGKKIGMSQIFDENGNVIPVTIIEAGPCVVAQKKPMVTTVFSSVSKMFPKRNSTRLQKATSKKQAFLSRDTSKNSNLTTLQA